MENNNIIICLTEGLTNQQIQHVVTKLETSGVSVSSVMNHLGVLVATTNLTNDAVKELAPEIVSVQLEKTVTVKGTLTNG